MKKKLFTLLLVMLLLLALPMLAVMAAETAPVAPAPLIDLTGIAQAVVALICALVTYKLIPWLKSKTTAQQQDNLRATVRVLVYAAEQLYGAGRGDEKLDYVGGRLKDAGYSLATSDIRDMIEASVKELAFEQGYSMATPLEQHTVDYAVEVDTFDDGRDE
jgi:hypothetical protein